METWTKTCGPYPGGLILTHTHLIKQPPPNALDPKEAYSLNSENHGLNLLPHNMGLCTKLLSKRSSFFFWVSALPCSLGMA